MAEVLLLNANYEPLNVCNVSRAVSLVLLGKAEILHEHDQPIRTSRGTIVSPSIVARDLYTCQYCGSRKDLTLDHVVPRWCGGPHTWENLVTCCRKCNLKKGDKTPQQANMKLKKVPRRPHFVPYLSLPKYMKAMQNDEWAFYLPVFEEFGTTMN
jgi:5-methylcytosine-specific restriction endonuclease McrA